MGISGHFLFCLISPFVLSFTKLTVVSAFSVFENGHVDPSNCTLQPETERMKREFKDKIEQASSAFDNMRVQLGNCSLHPETERMKLELQNKIDEGNRLIKLNITVNWNLTRLNDAYPYKMLRYMATDDTGKHLLSLDEDFEIMSLGTLSYGITDLRISMVQEPDHCLVNLTATDADKLLKLSLLNLPKTPKAVNVEENKIIYICTGFVQSGGTCCNLLFQGGDIRCQTLLDDNWFKTYNIVITILALILISHSIYLIPRIVYEDDNLNSYHLADKDFKLSVNIIEGEPDFEKWRKVNKKNSSFLDDVFRMIEEKLRKGERRSEAFDLFIKSVKRMDIELVSERSHSNLLKSLYKSFEYAFFDCSLKTKCLNALFKIFIILLCTSPIITRTVLSFMIHYGTIPWDVYLVFTTVFISFVFKYTFLSCGRVSTHQIMKESLRSFHDFNFERKIKLVASILLFPMKKISCVFWCLLLPFLLSFGLTLVAGFCLPAIPFFFIFFYRFRKEIRVRNAAVIDLLFMCPLVLYFSCDIAFFFAECISFVIIGLFLNYERIVDQSLFILILLTYIFDCLLDVHKKINSFNRTVLSLLLELSENLRKQAFDHVLKVKSNTALEFRLSKTHRKSVRLINMESRENGDERDVVDDVREHDVQIDVEDNVRPVSLTNVESRENGDERDVEDDVREHDVKIDVEDNVRPVRLTNTESRENGDARDVEDDVREHDVKIDVEDNVRPVSLTNVESGENGIQIFIGDDGTPFLSVDGLYFFYKFEKPDKTPYLHIPHSFFDEMASKLGQPPQGRAYIILLKACAEIAFLSLVLLTVYLIINGFARENKISVSVHALVSFGSCAAIAALIKLVFKSSQSSLIGQDLHLKEQIIRQLQNVKDIWFDAELHCPDSLPVDRPYEHESEYDILVRTGNGRSVKALYLKKNYGYAKR